MQGLGKSCERSSTRSPDLPSWHSRRLYFRPPFLCGFFATLRRPGALVGAFFGVRLVVLPLRVSFLRVNVSRIIPRNASEVLTPWVAAS